MQKIRNESPIFLRLAQAAQNTEFKRATAKALQQIS